MRFRRSIEFAEKILLPKNQVDSSEDKSVIERLVQNSEEFRECLRQLFRLQCKVGQSVNWEQWQETYREQASNCNKRINELIEQHKKSKRHSFFDFLFTYT